MNAALVMKDRMRADLRAALKEKRLEDVKVLRTLVAALDNAEAPAVPPRSGSAPPMAFGSSETELDRLVLGAEAVRTLLESEIAERESAAEQFTRRGKVQRAEVLRAEVEIARRYLGEG